MTPPTAASTKARTHRRAVAARVATLFDLHAGMVLGLCRLLLRDHHEAEDAAQQTFVSAYRSMLRGNEPRDAAPWLAAIARNECRARIKKRMRAPVALDGELEEQLADPVDLAEQTDRRAELAALTAAIAELPERQREAVALRDFLGLSYEEVASTLSVSVPVVESLLFRARRKLRDTVQTVPRYAAGLVALPLAIRGAFSRELPDLDSVGTAGLAGAATATAVGAAAKLISLPFASKAATAVTVVVAATVGTQVDGLFNDSDSTRPSQAVATTAAPGWPSGGVATPVTNGDQPGQKAQNSQLPVEIETQGSSALINSDGSAAPEAPSSTSGGGGSTGESPADLVEEETLPPPAAPPPPLSGEPSRDIVAAGASDAGSAPAPPPPPVTGDDAPAEPTPVPPEASEQLAPPEPPPPPEAPQPPTPPAAEPPAQEPPVDTSAAPRAEPTSPETPVDGESAAPAEPAAEPAPPADTAPVTTP